MNVMYVHPVDVGADAGSISEALARARAGDVVLVGPGVYSPSRTGEV